MSLNIARRDISGTGIIRKRVLLEGGSYMRKYGMLVVFLKYHKVLRLVYDMKINFQKGHSK